MSGQAAKRQRANTNGDTIDAKIDEYREIIRTFDERKVRQILLWAAVSLGPVGKKIIEQRDEILKAESVKVIDFDHYSKSAWRELQQGQTGRGSRQYELGLDASVSVCETIREISEQTPAHASFGTKESALETLRKIGKSIVLRNGDSFAREIRKAFSGDNGPLDNAMVEIVDEMTEEEKTRMAGNTEWVEKVEELIELGSGYVMFEGLRGMLDSLGLEKIQDSAEETGPDEESATEEEVEKLGSSRKRKAPYYLNCGGCGCGDKHCSSCQFDED